MKLQVPFIQLPLLFRADALADEVAALGEEVWKPHPQGFPGNSMLPLVAAGGDPDNESFAGAMRPTAHLQRCPYLVQVIASLGATVGRTRLMRLAGQAEVKRHADQGYYWAERVRVHVPIVTQPTVRFECGAAAINMRAGECWIFDTWRQHRVLNDATESRIHLVCDTVGGGRFWELVGRGRPHDMDAAGWPVETLQPRPGVVPALRCETMNIPTVMTPWEVQSHLGLLFADAMPHANLAQVRQRSLRLMHEWQGLWAAYGDGAEGRPHYRAALDRFVQDVQGPGRGIVLKNELQWFSAMMTIVAKFAVGAEPGAARMTSTEQRAVGDNA